MAHFVKRKFVCVWGLQITARENPKDTVNSDDSCFNFRQFSLRLAVVLALNYEACLYLSIDR